MQHNQSNMRSLPEPAESPFLLVNVDAYKRWRDSKLAAFPAHIDDIKIAVADLANPTPTELARISGVIKRANLAVYMSPPRADDADGKSERRALQAFLDRFGLVSVERHRSAEKDGFVAIEVSDAAAKRGFIPYTTRPLNWHTDGYYNPPESAIRAMLLHCVRAAVVGGENALLDPEIAYIRLRDANPLWVAALMRPDAMTIPESVEEDGSVRPVSVGPVFAVDEFDGSLRMRYTARGRSIAWRDDKDTRGAVAFLEQLLKEGSEPLIFRVRLAPGEGLICNNVLHTRTAFDGSGFSSRLILRARFATRISTRSFLSATSA